MENTFNLAYAAALSSDNSGALHHSTYSLCTYCLATCLPINTPFSSVEMWKSAQTGSPEASIFHQQKSAEKNAEMLTIGVMAAALNFPLEKLFALRMHENFPSVYVYFTQFSLSNPTKRTLLANIVGMCLAKSLPFAIPFSILI